MCKNTRFRIRKVGHTLRKGNVLFAISATRGGYWSPLDRDLDAVRLDVWSEESRSIRRRAFGVIDPSTLSVEDQATSQLREQLRTRETASDWAPTVAGHRPWPRRWADLERL